MKKLIKRIFNIPTTTDLVLTPDQLAAWLKEPVPSEAATVLEWHNKHIPANQF